MIKVGSQMFNSNEDVAMTVWKVFCFVVFILPKKIYYFIIFNSLFYFSSSLSCFFFLHQTAPKFEQPNNKIGRISIDLPQTILITIEIHGKGVLNGVFISLF
jgi:hypothetical protein